MVTQRKSYAFYADHQNNIIEYTYTKLSDPLQVREIRSIYEAQAAFLIGLQSKFLGAILE